MLTTTRRVLKANEVTVQDPLCLGFGPLESPQATEPPYGAAPASARIVQNQPDHAVIEVTCRCGQTTLIRCEYDHNSSVLVEA